MYQCFKIVSDTDYDKAIKNYYTQRPKWKNVMSKVGELLGEKISQIVLDPDKLRINPIMFKDENKKLFTNDGKLKNNSNKAKEIGESYKKIINDEGLSDFKELGIIDFCYGVMKLRGQYLESFITSDYDVYYKADFNLEQRSKGLVRPITEIEYEEKYLEGLKIG